MSDPTPNPNEIRVQIIDAVTAAVLAAYGPAGSVEKTFRAVNLGAWRPGAHPAPSCVVSDAGQGAADLDRAGGGEDGYDLQSQRTLRIQLTLELPAQWDRPASYRKWINTVENLHGLICAAALNVAGIEQTRYVADDIWTAALTDSTSVQIWTLDYETDYFISLVTPTT